MTTPTTREHALEKTYRAFFTPGRKPRKTRAEAILEQGRSEELPFLNGHIAVSVWGHPGPRVLLMHGWGGDRSQMASFVEPLLEAGYRVVALDLPAHGDSSGELSNVLEMGDALEILAAQFGPFQMVIAHSFGTLVTSYTLVNRDFPLPDKLVYFGTLNRLMDTLPRFQAIAGIDDRLLAAIRDHIHAQFGKEVLDAIANESLTPQLNIPALMFHDRLDLVTPVDDSRAVAAAWPTAHLIETEGLGHRRALRALPIISQVIDFLNK
jgi:pimeloyl-ACP methyl ester carboxylesterase